MTKTMRDGALDRLDDEVRATSTAVSDEAASPSPDSGRASHLFDETLKLYDRVSAIFSGIQPVEQNDGTLDRLQGLLDEITAANETALRLMDRR